MNKTKSINNSNIASNEPYVKDFVPQNPTEQKMLDDYNKPNAKRRQGAGPNNRDEAWVLQLPILTWREKMKDLTLAQRCIFVELVLHQRTNPDCYPSQKKIAKNLNADIKTIEKNLPIVIRKMNIKVIKKIGRSNHYKIPTPF